MQNFSSIGLDLAELQPLTSFHDVDYDPDHHPDHGPEHHLDHHPDHHVHIEDGPTEQGYVYGELVGHGRGRITIFIFQGS